MNVTESFNTAVTKLLGIRHPILLAGMNVAAGPALAAAVTNSGGLGVIGGVGYTPKMLRKNIALLKKDLKDPNGKFGVDLLLPKVGDGARATNYDYTKGKLDELIDIIIEEKASLFVSAVGVPPKRVVERLHAAGILVMNMIGHPKHVKYAIAAGVDLICAQGGEGGGHTGSVPTSVLVPKAVDLCKGTKSPFTGEPIHVIAAGGIFDGRGLASALAYGAQAVWIGTRFVACKEAGAPKRHKNAVVKAGYEDTHTSLIYTGRPLRILKNHYSMWWENDRREEMKKLTSQGILPYEYDMEHNSDLGEKWTAKQRVEAMPLLMGKVAGAISDIPSADEIITEMVTTALRVVQQLQALPSKL